jgi:ubiquinone/menaquinone biosynthesis C-methylase UbiE
VLGVDLAEQALTPARAKAQAQGLTNVEFRAADVERTGLPPESFDVVVCVFGIFFLPDMAAAVAELWRLVRPGGTLAVTVWGPRFLEPATAAFWEAEPASRTARERMAKARGRTVRGGGAGRRERSPAGASRGHRTRPRPGGTGSR